MHQIEYWVLRSEDSSFAQGCYHDQRFAECVSEQIRIQFPEKQPVVEAHPFGVAMRLLPFDDLDMRAVWKRYLGNHIRLDIGCGTFKREGFVGVDIESSVNPDILAPMWDIPLGDGDVDEIYSSHALEHVTKFQVVPVLKEWRRLLKVGGVAVIEVPDLAWCCENWLYRRSNDWHLDTIFGQCTTEGEQHRTGFTPDIMAGYLREAGLTLLAQRTVDSHGQPTLQFEVQRQS